MSLSTCLAATRVRPCQSSCSCSQDRDKLGRRQHPTPHSFSDFGLFFHVHMRTVHRCFQCRETAAAGTGRESHLADDAEAHKYTEPQCYDAHAHRTHSSGRSGVGQMLVLHKACFCVLTAPAELSRILRPCTQCSMCANSQES